MTPVLALFRASLRRALPVKRTVLFGLLSLTPALLFVLAAENRTGEAAFDTLVETSGGAYFGLLMPVIAIVLAAGALGDERRDQTLSFITLRPMPRWVIAATKIAAAATAAFAINLIGIFGLWLTYSIQHTFNGTILVGYLVGTVIAVAAYVSIVVPLGFITDRAVIIGLAYLLVFEDGVVIALSGLASLSPWRLGAAAFAGVVEESRLILDGAVGNLTMTVANSAITAGIYVLIGAAITTALLKRRDLA